MGGGGRDKRPLMIVDGLNEPSKQNVLIRPSPFAVQSLSQSDGPPIVLCVHHLVLPNEEGGREGL